MQPYVNVTLLRIATAVLAGFGVIIALAAWPPASGFIRFLIDLFAWPLDGAQTLAANETRLALAIAGGVMAGWGVMIWMATDKLAQSDPGLLRSLVLVPVGVWYVVDSAGSFASGIGLNVAVNTAFALLFFAAFWGRKKSEG